MPGNAGPVAEAAFFHRATKSLVTTDAVVFVPDGPPDIFWTYFGEEQRADKGFWPRSVLQAVFLPLRKESGNWEDGTGWPGYCGTD